MISRSATMQAGHAVGAGDREPSDGGRIRMKGLHQTSPISGDKAVTGEDSFVPYHPLNPCALEIDLFCKGMRIADSCSLDSDSRPIQRTRAGLGSGLEIVIPGRLKDIWVNVPVLEAFAQRSPYRLVWAGNYFIKDDRRGLTYPVRLSPEPAWYSKFTSRGVPMNQIGVLQGTYLAIYVSNSCGFWHHRPPLNCKFCTTGLNVGVNEVAFKDVADVVEVARAAKRESGTTFVHFNSGFQSGKDLDRIAPYVKAVKSQVGSLIGVQATATAELWKYDRLIDLGTDHFSFCYEFKNPEYFERICPGKAELVGQKTFLRALEYVSKKLGKGTCSGEIIAGIEPIEETMDAIDDIVSLGAFPTVCIFRPTQGSAMENWPSPRFDDMILVFHHLYEACRKSKLLVDVTPNIEVSLVVQPGDTQYLAEPTLGSWWYNLKLKGAKKAARPYFLWKARPKNIKASEVIVPY